jgi:hypothetical protein
MRFFLNICILLTLIISSFAAPLDLGYGNSIVECLIFKFLNLLYFLTGGVYNSPEANAYWARRFGSLFGGRSGGGSSLRSLQVRKE